MPNWTEVLKEIRTCQEPNPLDYVRRKYLSSLSKHTGRNTIAYYSGWLQKPSKVAADLNADINDDDKNGFMATIHGIDRTNGLDLILHTPGGGITATESIVYYLKKMFGNDIRAIVPQIAMSAGTMIACACKSIVMGKQSNIGPIDPQINGVPANGIISEFDRAIEEVKNHPYKFNIWKLIIGKYHPTFLGECKLAIDMSSSMVRQWLIENMFSEKANGEELANRIVDQLSNHEETMNHGRHIHIDQAEAMDLHIEPMENDKILQDLVLTVHHSYMHTFANSGAIKIIENHIGNAVINNLPFNPQPVPIGFPRPRQR